MWGKHSPGKGLEAGRGLVCLRNRKGSSMSAAQSRGGERGMGVQNEVQATIHGHGEVGI